MKLHKLSPRCVSRQMPRSIATYELTNTPYVYRVNKDILIADADVDEDAGALA